MKQTKLWLTAIAALLCSLTVSAEAITDLSQLDNTTLFHVSTPRGSWAVAEGSDALKSDKTLNITSSSSDTRQQFAFVSNDDGASHYLYHAAEKKFVNMDGSLGYVPVNSVYFKEGAYANTFIVYFDNSHYINIGGTSQMELNSWNIADDGNSCSIVAVKTVDLSEALDRFPTIVDGFTYTKIDDGKVELTSVVQDSASGEIIIPATVTDRGKVYQVTSIGDGAFSGCCSLTSITIPESVTSIGNYAFDDCTSLEEINFEAGNEELQLGYNSYHFSYWGVGEGLFYDCPLERIFLGRNLNYKTENHYGYSPFCDHSKLQNVTIEENVESFGYRLFYGCNSLTSITIPECVTSIGEEVFYGCNNLKKVINFSNLVLQKGSSSYGYVACYADKVYNVSYVIDDFLFATMAGQDYLLAYVGEDSVLVLPNESSYAIDANAFSGNNNLTSVTIPSSVTSIGDYVFYNCSSLTSINIPESVTSIGNYAFDNCTSLKEVIFEDGSETLSLGYNYYYSSGTGQGLFYDCPLETVYLGRNLSYSSGQSYGYSPFYKSGRYPTISLGDGITSVGAYLFYENSNLTSITLPGGVTSIGDYAFRKCRNLTSITIPEGVTSIGGSAFYNCSSLTSITIPEGVTSIGGSAFYNCSSLTSINIPESVTSIGSYAFSGCSSLKTVINYSDLNIQKGSSSYGYVAYYANKVYNVSYVIDDFLFTTVAEQDYLSVYLGEDSVLVLPDKGSYAIDEETFLGSKNITSITLPESVTSIGDDAFSGCSSLASITLPESVTSIGDDAFSGCSSLASITIPESVTIIGSGAFSGCNKLTDIHISSIESWLKIEYEDYSSHPNNAASSVNLYIDGEKLTKVDIPEGVTSIGDCAFAYCNNLTSITIPEGVTSIGDCAFCLCSSLTSITIPEVVTSIGDCAFCLCSSLTSVTCYAQTPPSLGVDVFYNVSATLRVPVESLQKYSSNQWNKLSISAIGSINSLAQLNDTTLYHISTIRGSWAVEQEGDIMHSTRELKIECNSKDSRQQFAFISFDNGETHYLYHVAEKKFVNADGVLSDNPIMPIHFISGAYDDTFVAYFGKEFYVNISTSGLIIDSYYSPDPGNSCSFVPVGAFDPTEALSREITLLDFRKIDNGEAEVATVSKNVETIEIPSTTMIEGELCEVTSIGDYAFRKCRNLTSITLPGGVTSIGERAFYWCSSLTSVTLPESVTSIGDYAFYYCSNLTFINIPESVTSIGDYAFYNCGNLTSINIPESVTDIGNYAFSGCSSLKRVTLNCLDVGNHFSSLAAIEEVVFGNSVISIEGNAFSGCSGITSIVIGENVTSIGSNAFSGCSGLKSLSVGTNVDTYGENVFKGCTAVEELTVMGSVMPMVPSDKFTTIRMFSPGPLDTEEFDAKVYRTATLYVPKGSLARYQMADVWKKFWYIEEFDPNESLNVTLDRTTVTMTEGDVITLVAAITPQYIKDKTVTWSSSNTSVATVDKQGVVTAVAGGTATITATVDDKEAACVVTVLGTRYVITYLVDGDIVQTDSVAHGTAITLPEAPTKEGYTFSGWDKTLTTMPAEDVTISGTFTVNKYLVTFKIGDEVIAVDSLEYGAAIIAPEAPEKEGHTFNGWGEVAETVPTHDLTYEGSYSINSYLLSYVVDGETVQADSVAYGTAIILLDEPVKEGYTFSGWSEVPETMLAHDVTICGTFAINKYLVTFKIGDEVIAVDSLEYGAAIVAPEAPEKEGYTFNGWGEMVETVPASDVAFEGTYSANIYKVYYYVGEELVHTAEVAYGEAIPEYIYEPNSEGDVFQGWSGETYETMPAHDVTYVANITNGIDAMSTDNGQQTTAIYDLMGRKVTDTENLKGGIYIVNDRKVVIK